IRNFRWECSFSTWLYRILVNVNKDFVRKAGSAEIVSLDQLAEQSDDALPCVRSEVGQPEEEAIRQEECETLAEAIRALPRLDSSVLWMREALNLSYAEIADNLGCSVESVRSRLWRARRRLRENMALLIPEHVPQ
ncbi:MAG: sigma-70 family RNA polymerase sigma factor, partial [Bacillota bacterium]